MASMLVQLTTYIASNSSFVAGSTLFAIYPPDTSDICIALVGYGHGMVVEGMGGFGLPPVAQYERFQAVSRAPLESDAYANAKTVHGLIRGFKGTLSGTKYKFIRTVTPPTSVGVDERARYVYTANYEAVKDES